MIRTTNVVLLALLFLGAALSFFGLTQLTHSIGWSHTGRYNFAFFVLGTLSLIVLGAKISRKSPMLIGVALGLGITLIAGALWPLLATLWFLSASLLLGHHIHSLLGISLEERADLFRLITGAGCYGTLVSAFAHFPINYHWLYGCCLLLPFVIRPRLVVFCFREFKQWFQNFSVDKDEKLNWFDVLLTLLGLVYFTVSLMPELGHDALAMHLFISAHMAHQHHWGFDVSKYVWAVMPMLGDWIYSVGYVLAGETASRLINLSFVFLLTQLIRELVLWCRGDQLTVKWTLLLFLSTPLTFSVGSSLFVESIWSTFVISGAMILFLIDRNSQQVTSQIVLGGCLLGFAVAAKAIALMFLPPLFLMMLWKWRAWLKTTYLPQILSGFILFSLLGCIPYFTAYYKTGNPVFPFYNGIFQSDYYPSVNFDSSKTFGKGVHWDFPYRVTFHSEEFLESHVGGSGFQWLLLLLPAIGLLLMKKDKRVSLVFVVAAVALCLTFRSVSYLRYVFPEWVLLTVVAGCMLFNREMREYRYRKFITTAGALTLALNFVFLNSAAFYGDFQISSLLSTQDRKDYLKQRMPLRNVVELVNHLNQQNTAVAIFTYPLVAGLSADALHHSWYNYQFQNLITSSEDEQSLARGLMQQQVDYVVLSSNWGTPEKRKLIQSVTNEILEVGDLSVRQISDDYKFSKELLSSSDFQEISKWTLGKATRYDASGRYIAVDVNSPAYQIVPVKPNRQYRNDVIARSSGGKTQGRMQVNWLDLKGNFISTDIRPIECSNSWNSYSMKVTSPANAESAIVYASGHSESPVLFKKNSFLE